MTPTQRNRLMVIVSVATGIIIATALVLYALSQNINLFYTPEDILLNKAEPGQNLRMGGMVVPGSIVRGDNLKVDFVITDFKHNINISYQGILPDLFKENQGVVVDGTLTSQSSFHAKQVLAKHDEKYMPPTMAKKINT